MRVLHASAFAPRGGSAQVVRYLTKALIARGAHARGASGSLGDISALCKGVPRFEVDYAEACDGYPHGIDPMSHRFAHPLPPSYEDRGGVPDRAFCRVGRAALDHLVKRRNASA